MTDKHSDTEQSIAGTAAKGPSSSSLILSKTQHGGLDTTAYERKITNTGCPQIQPNQFPGHIQDTLKKFHKIFT